VPENDQHFVYVVADGKAHKREIKIGRRRPGEVEVLDGLGADDGVVVDGTLNLRDGVPVRVQGNESLAADGHENGET
jgi:membrane fusion protein, multidrug efflux system